MKKDVSWIKFAIAMVIILKLAKVISWSWWIVLAPIWGMLLLFVVGVIFAVIKVNKIKKENR